MSKDVASEGLFDDLENNRADNTTAAEDANQLHGASPFGGMQSIRVSKRSIFEIEPDYLQPRRVIPSDLRRNWNLTPDTIQDFLKYWLDTAEINPRLYFDDAYEAPEYDDPIQVALQKVIRLAAEIHRNTLTNPITLSRLTHSSFQLETGERRWMAYHVLFMLFGDEYKEIPARIMNEKSIWRQASENNQRDDLNAISRARQYALLLMDLLRGKSGEREIKPPESFNVEQEFYAQVKDERIPYGKGEMFQQAMGFENRSTVNRHRDLLELPNDIWNAADDFDAPESVLRGLIGKSYAEQQRIFNAWLSNKEIVASGNNSPTPKKISVFDKYISRSQDQRELILKDLKKGKNLKQWRNLVEQEIEAYQELLDQMDDK